MVNDPTGQTFAAAPPPSTAARSRSPLLIAVVAVVLVLLIAGGSLFFVLRSHQSSGMASVVPSGAALYMTANVEPGGSQGRDLNAVLGHFDASTSSLTTAVNQSIDQALQPLGLSHTSLDTWFNGQVGVDIDAVPGGLTSDASGAAISGTSGIGDDGSGDVAILLGSNNNSAATTMINALKGKDTSDSWSTGSYDGVNYDSSKPKSGGAVDGLVAMTNSTVIVTDGLPEMRAALAAATGHSASISSNADYTATMAMVPSTNLLSLYVAPQAMLSFAEAAAGSQGLGASSAALQAQIGEYTGVGMTFQATSSGLSLAYAARIDSSRLTAAETKSVSVPQVTTAPEEHLVPTSADGFLLLTGANLLVSELSGSAVSSAAQSAGVGSLLTALDPARLTSLMSGNAALWADDSDGALVIGTNNASAMASYLNTAVPALACSPGQSCTSGHTTVDGTDVSTLTISAGGSDGVTSPVTVAWAVSNNEAIIGLSQTSVEAALDARSGSDITGTPGFRSARSLEPGSVNTLGYVNIAQLLTQLGAGAPFTSIKSVIMTSKSTTSSVTGQIDVTIG